jgi:hypothetical protein
MSRFQFIHTIYGVDGEHNTPYMTRVWLGRLRLHIFHRGDADPDCHDHPWDFWTFPLTSYVEEVAEKLPLHVDSQYGTLFSVQRYRLRRQVVRAFRLHYRPATHCHRVIGRWTGRDEPFRQFLEPEPWPETDAGRIYTLVWRGRSGRAWGFLKNRDGQWCWTPWRDYVFGGGKHAPCEPKEGGDA